MLKKIILVGLLIIFAITAWLTALSPSSKPQKNGAEIKRDTFKEVSLDLRPTKNLAIDRPSELKRRLLSMLKKEQFSALDKAIGDEAAQYDQGKLSEPDFDQIINGLAQIDPTLEQPILNWIDHSKSWAAYTVATRYFKNLSWQWRGNAFWHKVPEQNKKKFNAYQDLAKAISDKAKQNNNRDVMWYSDRISLANQNSSTNELSLIKEALALFPQSILVHHSAIHAQSEKWAGNEYFRQEMIHNYAMILDDQKHDGGPTILFYAATDSANKKDYISAIKDIREAIKLNPNRLFYYSRLARYYYQTDQHALALAAINQTLEHRPYRTEDLLRRANILLDVDKPEAAIKDLETLLSFSPIHKEANTKAFSAYAKIGKRNKALKALEQAGYFTQHNARELSRQGFFARYDLKDIELAKSYYDRALAIDSEIVAANYAYATLYGEQQNCRILKHLHQYLKSCASSDIDSQHWCKSRYKNWAVSSVNHLKSSRQCPEIDNYDFDSLF